MTTDEPPPRPSAQARLAWLDLQDGTFPAGRFVHSNGLEAWLGAHPTAGEAEIAELVGAHLAGSVASLDAVFVAHAWREPDRALELDRLLTTHKLSAAARAASEGAGRQLALAADRVLGERGRGGYLAGVLAGDGPGNQAVVEGVLHRSLDVDAETTVLGFLRGAVSGLFSAAVRLGRLGPLGARRLTFDLHGRIAELATVALGADLARVHTGAPELEIHAMRHERVTTRLFAT